MNHRMTRRRWQENPERRVGQAQLNRVAAAEKTAKPQPELREDSAPPASRQLATGRP